MSEHEISRDEHQFRIAVIRQLTELNASTNGVVSRLDTLNGSVAKHEARLTTIEMKDAAVSAANEAVANARLESRQKWVPWVRPVMLMFVTLILALILMNGPALVKFLK